MKKSLLLLGLISTAACLTACGSKTFDMSFEEALEIANHSELQDILSQNDNFEQSFDIVGNYNGTDWTKVDASISSESKQGLVTKNSESSTKFDANLTIAWEAIKANWSLDLKLVNDTIYLNLSSLELTGSEEIAMYGMMVDWFKNKWYSIPMSGLSDIPNTFSILKDSKDLSAKTKDIFVNEWSVVYSWKFAQFSWYNAWKFSLDSEKLNALIKEYLDSFASLDEEFSDIPEIDIQDFEGYLVITWKDKVTTVIEKMAMESNGSILNVEWFDGEDLEIKVFEDAGDEISIAAHKNGGKYDVSVNFADIILLDWTVSTKLSKSSIDLAYDLKVTVKEGAEIVVPLKWSWKYKAISEFSTVAPEDAQNLFDLFGASLGWSDYDYDSIDYDDADYDYEDSYADESTGEFVEAEAEVAVEEAVAE